MKKALEVLNDLERDGVIGRYAIGGAMGATFYVEPFTTFDLDVFVVLPEAGGSLFLPSIMATSYRHIDGTMSRAGQRAATPSPSTCRAPAPFQPASAL